MKVFPFIYAESGDGHVSVGSSVETLADDLLGIAKELRLTDPRRNRLRIRLGTADETGDIQSEHVIDVRDIREGGE